MKLQKKKVKKTLTLTKKECELLKKVHKGRIRLASDRKKWSSEFFDQETKLFKPTMINLVSRGLIRYSYQLMQMETTKLGKTFAKMIISREKDNNGAFIKGLSISSFNVEYKNKRNNVKMR